MIKTLQTKFRHLDLTWMPHTSASTQRQLQNTICFKICAITVSD